MSPRPLGPADLDAARPEGHHPLEMATAYATFANDGLQVDPIFIERVEDSDGTVIFETRPLLNERSRSRAPVS